MGGSPSPPMSGFTDQLAGPGSLRTQAGADGSGLAASSAQLGRHDPARLGHTRSLLSAGQAREALPYALRIHPAPIRDAHTRTPSLLCSAVLPPYCARLLCKQRERMPWQWAELRKPPHTSLSPIRRQRHAGQCPEAAARGSGHGGCHLPHHSLNLHDTRHDTRRSRRLAREGRVRGRSPFAPPSPDMRAVLCSASSSR